MSASIARLTGASARRVRAVLDKVIADFDKLDLSAISRADQEITCLRGRARHPLDPDAATYLCSPANYLAVDCARRLLFEEGEDEATPGLRVAELGCTYGPYLFFLKEACGLRDLKGVDIDAYAANYGRSMGLDILVPENNSIIPLPDASRELIITQHVLDPEYMYAREITALLKEIARVLSPGGVYISSNDIFYCFSLSYDRFVTLWKNPPELSLIPWPAWPEEPMYENGLGFSQEVIADILFFDQVRVFVKG
jgi:SAM-dependent methyltransferase